MNIKSGFFTSVVKTVEGVQAVGNTAKRGTLFVTDYTEFGTEKVLSGVKVAVVSVPKGIKSHRAEKAERIAARAANRAAKKAEKAELDAIAALVNDESVSV